MRKVVDAANGLRERKKARTREAIIDAALDLFAAKGFEATTVEDIAAAAEVSPRTFFRYFESKLDLVMARTGDQHEDIGPLVAARPPDEDVLDAVRAVIVAQLGDDLHDPRLAREVQVMLTDPTLRKLARDHFEDEVAGLGAVVAERLGLDADDLAAHVVAGSVSSALWIAVNRWVGEGSGEPDRLVPMIDETFALLAGGLRTDALLATLSRRRPAR